MLWRTILARGDAMKQMREFLQLIWRHSRAKTVLLFALNLMSSVTEGIGLLLLVPLLAHLQTDQPILGGVSRWIEKLGLPQSLSGLLGLFFALVVLRSVISYARTMVWQDFQLNLIDTIRVNSFNALLHANWNWISNLKKSDHSNFLINEVDRIDDGVTYTMDFCTGLAAVLAYIVVAASLSFQMAIVALLVGASVMFFMRAQHRRARDLGENLGDAYEDMQQVVEEGLSSIKLTKILGNEDRHRNMMADILARLRTQQLAFSKTNAAAGAVFQIVIALVLVGFLWVGVKILELPLPNLLILVLILARLAPMLRSMQNQLNQILHAWPALRNLDEITQMAATHRDVLPETIQKIDLQDCITLNGVGFTYQSRKSASLNDITLQFPARKTTAIIGASGAGKSTLADILMGLLAPDHGEMRVDGELITDQHRVNWRHSLAYVPQEVFLFHDTIRNNLLWANVGADDAALKQALQRSAAQFVFDLDDGLDTVVGDAGLRLSGGERQRIALARAMLQNPSVLILDEATSALDTKNEMLIRQSLDQIHGDMTVIVIGHRLPTLENADQVVVLHDGQVNAVGTWAALSQNPDAQIPNEFKRDDAKK
ncbi:ABC transporter ATP-binding protein [Amylibacter ulvae]|uniref:ABC transporter ATP-binding protein n=1 Tax=Paramylibacter ulvae TaxID=1651968 RepID=A0ABQ3D726_9RHOB|nr:ABC transporter ATP-binding protein [Amylibacter ulvae]GHA58860.1 ABC transporter ATP-binding protein [Amylibacter ulvae]